MPMPVMFAAGLGLSAGGAAMSFMGASQSAAAQQAILGLQMRAERQREKQMEMDARRRKLEMIRTQQQAMSASAVAAVSQNAQLGTGFLGGQAQIQGQTGFNVLGVQGNLEFGRNMFDINSQITQQKIAQSEAGTMSAMGSGLMSLGGQLIGSMGQFNSLMGGSSSWGGGYNYSSPSGYPGWASWGRR